jgi:hypothetical protein
MGLTLTLPPETVKKLAAALWIKAHGQYKAEGSEQIRLAMQTLGNHPVMLRKRGSSCPAFRRLKEYGPI